MVYSLKRLLVDYEEDRHWRSTSVQQSLATTTAAHRNGGHNTAVNNNNNHNKPLVYVIPTEMEIYNFCLWLFQKVQLSSECSIVCLIYVERLMETAKVPLVVNTCTVCLQRIFEFLLIQAFLL